MPQEAHDRPPQQGSREVNMDVTISMCSIAECCGICLERNIVQQDHHACPPDVLLQELCASTGVGVIGQWAVVAIRRGSSCMSEGHNGVEPHVGAKCLSDGP